MSAHCRERVVYGALLTYRDDPARVAPERAVRYHLRGAVAVDGGGRIAWRGPATRLPAQYRSLPADDYGTALLLPGFIDAHVHFPQHRMLAAPGRDLLDWLQRFTFPEESRYAAVGHASAAAEVFLDRMIRHGTTAAVVFSTVHRQATEILLEAAQRRRLALVTGKTMMDRNAPRELCDDPASGVRDSAELIEQWHGRGRLRYAITIRFAVTSSEAQLRAAGALAERYPDCHVHTHLAESEREIAEVRRDFPWACDYTDIYDRCGLLGPRSLFAHGIHLSERECERLSQAGSTVVHCPTSNTFLGSGLFDIGRLRNPRRPVGVGIATDIAGGTSYSMLHTMGEAYKVAMLSGQPLGAHDLFHLATRGNAVRLGLDDEIGCIEPGRWADLVVLDPAATPVLQERQTLSRQLEDTLFALAILGDDRAVRATYVAGQPRWQRSGEGGGGVHAAANMPLANELAAQPPAPTAAAAAQ